MSKVAVIKEEWPSIPGHAEETKIYTVKVLEEYEHMIVGKRHWYNRKQVYVRKGMFLRVLEVKEL